MVLRMILIIRVSEMKVSIKKDSVAKIKNYNSKYNCCIVEMCNIATLLE